MSLNNTPLGGLDVVVVMVSGVQYIVNMSKQQVLSKINA